MQFTPDTRNVGGRSLILQQLWGHRICLQQIKERTQRNEIPILSPSTHNVQPIQQRILQRNIEIHKKKLHHIQECLTERNKKEPSYFFRRLPSPLQYKTPSLKSKSTQEKRIEPPPKLDLQTLVPKSTKSLIDWERLLNDLHGVQYPLKKWIKEIAIKHQIFDENDFATLIRIIMIAYKLKQTTLVSLVSEIIEELEM